MSKLWKNRSLSGYDYRKLIDRRTLHDTSNVAKQIICDIDKTYLETSFESVIQLVKIPFEQAEDKITVDGANDVLKACRWGFLESGKGMGPTGLHFVSSSPPQLRSVLTEKLFLDYLDWDSDTFKNQAYNLRRARMDQLKKHVIYKSAAILGLLNSCSSPGEFVLVGDNAELDAFIYLGVLLFTRGKLSIPGYLKYIETAGASEKMVQDFGESLQVSNHGKIVSILIRRAPGYPIIECEPFTSMIYWYEDFYRGALFLSHQGFLCPSQLRGLTRNFHNKYGLSLESLAASLANFQENFVISSQLAGVFQAIRDEFKRLGVLFPELAMQEKQLSLEDFLQKVPHEEDILELSKQWCTKLGQERKTRDL